MNMTSKRYTAEQMRHLADLLHSDEFSDGDYRLSSSRALRQAAEDATRITTLESALAEKDRIMLRISEQLIAANVALAEAERDAHRYRWLRDAPATSESEPIRNWLWTRPYGSNMMCLDEAIDAAIARSTKNDDGK